MNEVDINVFQKLDIRIGTVLESKVPDWSHWVMRLKVDFGPEIGEKIIFSGIMKFYKPEELLGKQFPFVVNLKPKKIGPPNEDGEQEYSHGMMLMAVSENKEGSSDEVAPVFLNPQSKIPDGSPIH